MGCHHLSPDEVLQLLDKFEGVESIDSWEIETFLRGVLQSHARTVVTFLMDRICRGNRLSDRPRRLGRALADREGDPALDPEIYADILRQVRDGLHGAEWRVADELSKLFLRLAPGLPEASRQVLAEWVDAGQEDHLIAVGRVLAEAGSDFVFKEQTFIARLLDQAAKVTPNCERRVASELARRCLTGTSFIQRGEPSPRNLALRDAARAGATQALAETPARRFYEGLLAQAEALIREDLRIDED
jgi:hypothetical protein